MAITLEELNQAAKQLPHPQTSADMGMFIYRIPVPWHIPVAPLTDKPAEPHKVKIATFELRRYGENGAIFWRWTPLDDIVI
jgi:hypothetical protein